MQRHRVRRTAFVLAALVAVGASPSFAAVAPAPLAIARQGSVEAGGHGGSHGPLRNEFVAAILEDRQPLVNIAWALNMTVAGIVAHQSALKGGELLKIPIYAI